MSLLHPTTLVLDPDFADLTEFMYSLPHRFAAGEGTVIHRGRNELRLIRLDSRALVVKAFRRPHIINRLVYGTLRSSKAKRSFDNATMLRRLGIGTPRPVGYLNIRSECGLLFDRSYYVSLQSDCTHLYQELFDRPFACEEAVLRAIGRLTATLHEHGLAHRDYGRANILFEPLPDGSVRLDLVDLNRMTVGGTFDVKAGCRNFERLPATPQMHRWMAEEYAAARGFDPDECFRLMEAYRQTQPGKVDGKY